MQVQTAWKGLDERRRPVFLGYDRVELLLTALLEQAARWRPDHVVGIARGGTIPATMAATMLGLELTLVGFDRAGMTARGAAPGERILLVDDGASSGRTLHAVRQALARPGRACLTLAVVHDPDTAVHIPDLSHPMRELWCFPWERGEATPAGRSRRAAGAGPDAASEAPFFAVDPLALDQGYVPPTPPERTVVLAVAADTASEATRLGCTHLVAADATQALRIAAAAPHLLVTWWSGAERRGYSVSAAAQ